MPNRGNVTDVRLEKVGKGGLDSLPGLTRWETAVLAGFLVGLFVFLFLLLLILFCLTPRRRRHSVKDSGSTRFTDMESTYSYGASESLVSKENLHEVDIKLPRAWVDEFKDLSEGELDKRIEELEHSGWGNFRQEDFAFNNETVVGGYGEMRDSSGGSMAVTSRHDVTKSEHTTSASGGHVKSESFHFTGDHLNDGSTTIYRELRPAEIEAMKGESEAEYSVTTNTREINGQGNTRVVRTIEYYQGPEYVGDGSGIGKENYMKIYRAYKRFMTDGTGKDDTEA